jgi:hypothetical protein
LKTLKDLFNEKQVDVVVIKRNDYVIWCEALDRNDTSILENFAISKYNGDVIKSVNLEFCVLNENEEIAKPCNWFVDGFKVNVEIPMEEFYKGVDFLIKSMEEYYKGGEIDQK